MKFTYAPHMAQTFPHLQTGLIVVSNIQNDVDTDAQVHEWEETAKARFGDETESSLPEIQAWRAGYAKMGFKPTQVRCASEALLRRLRQHGSLPSLHPLVDLCNAASAMGALPVAAFDLAKVEGNIQVRPAAGDEQYQTFSGDIETPETDEIIFCDDGKNVHARRWVNRQSGLSAIQASTSDALIVIEGLHETAKVDVLALRDRLADQISNVWQGRLSKGHIEGAIGSFDTDLRSQT